MNLSVRAETSKFNNQTYLVRVTVYALHLVNVNLTLCCGHCSRCGAYSRDQTQNPSPAGFDPGKTYVSWLVVRWALRRKMGRGVAAFSGGRSEAASLSWQWNKEGQGRAPRQKVPECRQRPWNRFFWCVLESTKKPSVADLESGPQSIRKWTKGQGPLTHDCMPC